MSECFLDSANKLETVLEAMAEKGWDTFIDEVSGIEEYTQALMELLDEK